MRNSKARFEECDESAHSEMTPGNMPMVAVRHTGSDATAEFNEGTSVSLGAGYDAIKRRGGLKFVMVRSPSRRQLIPISLIHVACNIT